MRIRYKFIIGFLLLVGIGFYYLINWVIDDLRPRYLESVEEALVDEANILAEYVSINIKNGGLELSDIRKVFSRVNRRIFEAKIYKLKKKRVDLRIYITDLNGIVVFDSDQGDDEGKDFSQWRDVFLTLKGKYGARTSDRVVDDPATSTLHVASPILHKGELIGVLTVCKPTTNINFFIASAKPKIVIAGFIAAISIIVLSFILSIWITGPIKKLTGYARKIRDGLPAMVPKIKGGEVGDLARAFEEMREALEGKKYVEQYVQTLTHELKSPLSGIRGASELLQEDMPVEKRNQFLQNIKTDANRIQDVVDRMLQLASLESKRKLEEHLDFNIRILLDELIQDMDPQFKSKDVSIEFICEKEYIVTGERFLIRQAISNLLQNALDFSPKKSKVSLSVTEIPRGISVIVEDEGPGIPEYALKKVFDKFFSLPRPQTKLKSSGLGLSFVRQVMDMHCGSVRVDNKAPNGAVASINFPLIPSSA